MNIQQHVAIGGKTTMKIGGTAKYYVDLFSRTDVEQASALAAKENIPFLILGGGTNTVFADGEVRAVVGRIGTKEWHVHDHVITAQAGVSTAVLINELALLGFDLSALAGIPGTIGGAVFGNAGQGPSGIWIDHFVHSVTVYDHGQWHKYTKAECRFRYRESLFKDQAHERDSHDLPPVIWEVELIAPRLDTELVQREVENSIKKRIATQPHRQTAGSCFKAVETKPAWQLIDDAGLRGFAIGGVRVSEKHANFLISSPGATYNDAVTLVEEVRRRVAAPLQVEMRFIEPNGSVKF